MGFTTHPISIRIAAWIAGRDSVEHGEVVLDRKRVYILPTRPGVVFGAAMLVLLVGSINYGLQLGFLLTFLVISMALVGMYHTHRNLARLTVRAHHASAVFAGDVATFELVLGNPTPETRYAVRLNFAMPLRRRIDRKLPGHELPGPGADVPAHGTRAVKIGLPTRRRGRLGCPRVRIETRFPFGLWQAWAYYRPPLSALVYPAPETDAPPLPPASGGDREGVGLAASGDDFAGVRPYQPGDPQKMIAWRLAARSDDLTVKLFDAAGGGELMLDYAQLPAALSVEQKLSRLTRWVLMAEAAQLRYGVALTRTRIEPDCGVDHRDRCLKALALFRG
jgi:uncharacterized protein (DUF58 family)